MPGGSQILAINYPSAEREILGFIRKTVKGAASKGVVLGLSGGVDSAVTGALSVKALGRERVTVLIMPSDFTPQTDTEDANALAKKWGVRTYRANVSSAVEALSGAFGFDGGKIPRANIQARVRMTLAYYVANSLGCLVAGTGDRSEDLLGYFTKYGDGGVDLLPIAHLYKTQVRELAIRLGIPEKVANKPASPQLWPGHIATQELPADYDKLDPLLYCLFDRKMSLSSAAKKAGVGVELAKAAMRLHKSSAHKRALPPMVKSW